MNISIDIVNQGHANSRLFSVLNLLPKEILYHKEHGLRHPLAVYNISYSRILKAFKSLLDIFNDKTHDKSNLSYAHTELLNSIIAYKDDCFHILKCFYPKSAVLKNITFADRWLEKADIKRIKQYKDSLFPIIEKTNAIVNSIKHNHGRYGYIEITYPNAIGKVLGYYIQSPDEEGVIGPDLKIHPKSNGWNTAISFNKDIRDHFIIYYFVSELLAKTILGILVKEHSIYLKLNSIKDTHDELLISIINNIMKLKNVFFPDEYIYDLPQIIYTQKNLELRKPAYESYRK